MIYCCDIKSVVAGVCKSIDDCELWFTVPLSEGCSDINTAEGVYLRPSWGHQNILPLLPPQPPTPLSTESDTRHYTCSCLNITSPFFSSSSCHSFASPSPFLSPWELAAAEQDEFRRDNCSTGATGDVHIWCTVVMFTVRRRAAEGWE